MASINSELVLNYFKEHFGQELSKQEVAAKLGISVPAVTATVNYLTKRGFMKQTREDTVEVSPATETRKAQTRTVKYHTLTEEGLNFDPVAEAEEKAAAKAAEKEAKAAAREAARAAKNAEK